MRHRVTDHADTVAYADLVVIEEFHKTLRISVVRNWPIPLKKAAVAAQECQ
jgi:hypothetical protein